MEIPPGFVLLSQITPRLLIPPAAVFWASKWLFGDAIQRWLHILACLLAFPAVVFFNCIVVRYHHQRQAKLKGAVLAPSVPNRWPGGIDGVMELLDNFKHGYMGLFSFCLLADRC